jgi:multidrug efflux pump subunit AcrA (membrane-fusion protein)
MVATARLDSAAPAHRLAGTIHARTETDLGFRVAGKLLARPAEVGTRVEAGDVVARSKTTTSASARGPRRRSAARSPFEKAEIDSIA